MAFVAPGAVFFGEADFFCSFHATKENSASIS